MKVTQNYADKNNNSDDEKIIPAIYADFSVDGIRKTARLMNSWMTYSLLQQEREATLYSMLESLLEYAYMSNLETLIEISDKALELKVRGINGDIALPFFVSELVDILVDETIHTHPKINLDRHEVAASIPLESAPEKIRARLKRLSRISRTPTRMGTKRGTI